MMTPRSRGEEEKKKKEKRVLGGNPHRMRSPNMQEKSGAIWEEEEESGDLGKNLH